MPFRPTIAPSLFQEIMHTVFQDMEGCIWYCDDILIDHDNAEAENQVIVKKVLQQYVERGLADNLLKSKYHVKDTIFLSHLMNGPHVKMYISKLETMSKRPIPTKKKEVQALVGFPNYYHQYYCSKACPLID